MAVVQEQQAPTPAEPARQRDDHAAPARESGGPGEHKLAELLSRGPAASEVAATLRAFPRENEAMLMAVHRAMGNGFASEVMKTLTTAATAAATTAAATTTTPTNAAATAAPQPEADAAHDTELPLKSAADPELAAEAAMMGRDQIDAAETAEPAQQPGVDAGHEHVKPAKDKGSKKSKKDLTGIGATVAVGRFVAAAKKVQTDWATLTPEERASKLGAAANAELTTAGVPATTQKVEELSVAGQFDFETWSLELGKKAFEEPSVDNTDAADLADTVYHETRHAEQWHRMARYMAGQGKDADEIADQTSIPKRITTDAVAKPLDKKTPEGREAKAIYRSVEGKKSKHRIKVLTKLAYWRGERNSAEAAYDALAADPAAAPRDVRRALKLWKRNYKKWKYWHGFYMKLAEEADAWAVGDKTTAAFLALPEPSEDGSP